MLLVLRLPARGQPHQPAGVQSHRGAHGPRCLQFNHSCKSFYKIVGTTIRYHGRKEGYITNMGMNHINQYLRGKDNVIY